MWVIHVLLLIAVGLALADASVVTLALPPIIAELDASVEQAAAVLGVYTLVLALALPAAALVRHRALAPAGAVLFALASLGCGLAGSIELLLVFRGVQAVGGAALLVGAFPLLDAGGTGRRAWTAVAVFGFAAGPALGGALTQAFDWRAIFLAQVPIVAAAAALATTKGGQTPLRAATEGGQTPLRRGDAVEPNPPVGSDPLTAERGWGQTPLRVRVRPPLVPWWRWRCSRRRWSGCCSCSCCCW